MLKIESVGKWTKGTFAMRSGFYAGRGPTPTDLNQRILEMFYKGIRKDAGRDIARNFVRFVNNMNDLSASAFIVAFEQFVANKGEVVKIDQQKVDGIRLDGHGSELGHQSFSVIANALGGRHFTGHQLIQASYCIKKDFIQNHMDEIPAEEIREAREFV